MYRLAHAVIALAGALAPAVLAMPWDGPRETADIDADTGLGWSPKPTQAAMLGMNAQWDGMPGGEVAFRGLERRLAGRSTCGYVNAIKSSALYCSTGHYCATDTVNSVQECCPETGSCIFATTCYASSLLVSCVDSGCLSDTLAFFCTGFTGYPSYTQCQTLLFLKSHGTTNTQYQCGEISGVTYIEPTYVGEPTPVPTAGNSTASSSTPSPSPSPSTTVPPPSPSITSPIPPPTSSKSFTGSGSKTPVGAIAGGVVGGVAVIAILVAFLAWLRHKNKQDKAATTAAAATLGGEGGAAAAAGGSGGGPTGQGPPAPQYGHLSEVEGSGPNDKTYFAGAIVAEKDASQQQLQPAHSPGLTSVSAKSPTFSSAGLSGGGHEGLSPGGVSPSGGPSPIQNPVQPVPTMPYEMGDNREVHELA